MINKKRCLLSLLMGAAVLALGWLFGAFADLALWPGSVIASQFWPEGIHSDFGGMFSLIAMLAVVWVGAFLFWSALTYAVASLLSKSRAT